MQSILIKMLLRLPYIIIMVHIGILRKKANNNYTGYYYYAPGDNRGGIVIEYSNGNKAETGYHKCSDGKEAIENAIGK